MPNDDPQAPHVTTSGSQGTDAGQPAAASSDSAPETPPAAASTPPPPVPPADPSAPSRPSAWSERLSSLVGWLETQLRSPRTRLGVVGIVLLLAGIVWITNSAWTLPLVIVGIAMVMIAWVGSRLEGRFAIEWGKGGTQVEFRAQIKPPPPLAQPVRLSPIPSAPAARVRAPLRSELDRSDVIEGEGHTVEIDVAELKTLIQAAEAAEAARGDAAARGAAAPDSSQRRPAA